MGRRQTMMEKYKLQMKAYKKKRMKDDNTPFMPASGVVYIMNTINPDKKIKAENVQIAIRSQREVIKSIACPECGEDMVWDGKWEAFVCTRHPKRLVYEIVS